MIQTSGTVLKAAQIQVSPENKVSPPPPQVQDKARFHRATAPPSGQNE